MAGNILQKTSGIVTVALFVPEEPVGTVGSAPYPAENLFTLLPVSYNEFTGVYETGGKEFPTHVEMEEYNASILFEQTRLYGYGGPQGFFVLGMESANNQALAENVENVGSVSLNGQNPFLLATQSGQLLVRSPTTAHLSTQGSAHVSTQGSAYINRGPTHYSAGPTHTYTPPVGSGINMEAEVDRLQAYANAQFTKSSFMTLT